MKIIFLGQDEIVYQDPHLLRDFKKEEKDFHFLGEMYRSAQGVLSKQAEQQKAIQKCKDKVRFMTEEMETLQRETTEQAPAMFNKVNIRVVFHLHQLLLEE